MTNVVNNQNCQETPSQTFCGGGIRLEVLRMMEQSLGLGGGGGVIFLITWRNHHCDALLGILIVVKLLLLFGKIYLM